MRDTIIIGIIAAAMLLVGCHRDSYTPRPKAYLRIDLPQHSYNHCDTAVLPFVFDLSTSASLQHKKAPRRNEVWVDIVYPQWDGVVFLNYRQLAAPDSLRGQTDTSQRLLEHHYQFTSGIDEQQYEDPTSRVYAQTYRLHGSKVASTYQFWATDSNRHFLRGAFVIQRLPNNDSLAPVIEFIQTDLDHMIETLAWRN